MNSNSKDIKATSHMGKVYECLLDTGGTDPRTAARMSGLSYQQVLDVLTDGERRGHLRYDAGNYVPRFKRG